MSLCVVGSGSGGNCSILAVRTGGHSSAILIDIGLSPELAAEPLQAVGLGPRDVTDVLLTHFDGDHYDSGCFGQLPSSVTLRFHRAQLDRAKRAGAAKEQSVLFAEEFVLHGMRVRPLLLQHDLQGTVAYRFCHPHGDLGYVTDCGQATGALIEHLRDVSVLAIESNYDRAMELTSARPWFLKKRIMGGCGHLSNDQTRELVRAIQPRGKVILLHLSEECNQPNRILPLYEDHDPPDVDDIILSSQDTPTSWIEVQSATKPESQIDIVRRALDL